MDYYISVALTAVAAVLSGIMCLPILKILQLSGYKAKGVIAWQKASSYDVTVRYIAFTLFSFIAMIVYVGCFGTYAYARYCAVALYIILAVMFSVYAKRSKISDVKFTGRVKRLFALDFLIMLALGAGVAWASYYSPYCQTVTAALGMFAPLAAILSNAVLSPFERANNKRYIKRAKLKLTESSPTVIGITGSYGKTTAKNLLRDMLATEYSVLATPGSYNTPMGVCLTVNNVLADEKFLIAELGARYKGDIAELCDIVSPKYGIITSVGDMHLETLKSREGVAEVKYELGKALPTDGLLVLNGYNESCAALAERESACRKETVGKDGGISYEDIKIDGVGTSFTLVINGERYGVTTKLLGAHIPELVCVCAAVAIECGVSADGIVKAVRAAAPVEHRLQLLSEPDADVIVIDDAYNSNPIGAKNALSVLGCFDVKKVIITPGFVELGTIEKSANTELGKNIAEVCDHAFLIGTRAADIKKGAIEGGMNEADISVVSSRQEAVEALKSISDRKAVLFENDLPDNIK